MFFFSYRQAIERKLEIRVKIEIGKIFSLEKKIKLYGNILCVCVGRKIQNVT
jgi:hypothetical protein